MKQRDKFTYVVAPGETIMIHVSRVASKGTVVVMLDTNRLSNTGTEEQQKYEFKITKELGKAHLAQIEAAFPPSDGKGARFDVKVSDAKDNEFNVGSIAISDRIKRMEVKFKVRQG